MKRMFMFLMILMLSFVLVACGSNEGTQAEVIDASHITDVEADDSTDKYVITIEVGDKQYELEVTEEQFEEIEVGDTISVDLE